MKIANLTFKITYEYDVEIELTDEEFKLLENSPHRVFYASSKGSKDRQIIDTIEKYVDTSSDGWETSINDIFIDEIEEIEDEEIISYTLIQK